MFDFSRIFDGKDLSTVVVSWSQTEGLRNIGLGASGKSPTFLVNSANGSDIEGYSVQVETGQKIVGLYALLRSPFKLDFSFGGIDNFDLPSVTDEDPETIVALGIVTFDEANPRCGAAPSVADQYVYEWVFANLDTNFDQQLDLNELRILTSYLQEAEPLFSKGAFSIDFFTFVDLMRHEELIKVNGLSTLSQKLQRLPFNSGSASTADDSSFIIDSSSGNFGGSKSSDEDLASFLDTFKIDIMSRIADS